MAFYNENGQITIDENVAYNDIAKIRRALEKLQESKNTIQALKNATMSMSGKTVNAISESVDLIENRLQKNILELESIVSLIDRTVAKYRSIDEALRASIEGETATHTSSSGKVHGGGGKRI